MRHTTRTLTAALLAVPLVVGMVLPSSAATSVRIKQSGKIISFAIEGPETSDVFPGNYWSGSMEIMGTDAFGYVSPLLGQTLLIFAFIVTVIGGLGSLTGAAVASVVVALLQQFANYYLGGTGDLAVVVLLAVVLLTRPSGLMGRKVA